MGSGPSRIEKITTIEEWEIKAKALQEIFLQTLGEAPEILCPLSPEVIDEVDCGDYIKRKVKYSLEPDERISAYVLIPKNLKDKAPAVLCSLRSAVYFVNCHSSNNPAWKRASNRQ